LIGRTEQAFGPRIARSTSAVVLIERFLLAALASVVIGRYVASVAAAAIVGLRFAGHVTVEELSIQLAMGMVGLLWIRARTGLEIRDDAISRGVWLGAGIVSAAAVWGLATVMRAGGTPVPLPWHLMDMAGPTPGTPVELPATLGLTFTSAIHTTFLYLLGFAVALPALGSGGALARIAHQFAPPRIQALRHHGGRDRHHGGVRCADRVRQRRPGRVARACVRVHDRRETVCEKRRVIAFAAHASSSTVPGRSNRPLGDRRAVDDDGLRAGVVRRWPFACVGCRHRR